MELESYIINMNTLVVMPISNNKTKVIEYGKEFFVSLSSLKIIKNSCLYFGSSFDGRRKGTNFLIGSEMKTPIVVEEVHGIIFFPVSSCIRENSMWVSYYNLVRYCEEKNGGTLLYFNHMVNVFISCKYSLIDKQYIRCIKLENIIKKRNSFFSDDDIDFFGFYEEKSLKNIE